VGFPVSPLYYYLLLPGLVVSLGSGYSLIVSQTIFALVVLVLIAIGQRRDDWLATVLIVAAIGLSPWWITATAYPWNGHMYMSWLMMGLVCLWYKKHLGVGALLLGMAIAIHPAAALVLPILGYEWLSRPQKLRNLPFAAAGLILPWAPIILFEIITKGYLTRQWLQHAATGMTGQLGWANLTILLHLFGLPALVVIGLIMLTIIWGSTRVRWWLVATVPALIFLTLTSALHDYYLLGLVGTLFFLIAIVLSTKKVGKILLALMIAWFLISLSRLYPPAAGRSIQRINSVVAQTIQLDQLDRTKKYAVINVRDSRNETPQADDYRFFLRVHGLSALNINQYPQADYLLLFVEDPTFDWQNFNDWHTEQFGARKFISVQIIKGVTVILYGR
jgi:hypothetical protein